MKPTGVLIVGSVPGASPQEVFVRLATGLPGRLQAIPDGETGERWNYIGWQLQRFPLVARRIELGGIPLPESGLPAFTLADIEPISYDEVALSSYTEFKQLRQQNIIPSNVLFQICLPSPYSVLTGHVKSTVINAIEPLYEQRFAEAIDHIVRDIPHDDMGLVDRVIRLCKRIPEDVKLAFHLCYGDLRHKHFIEPQDTSLLVELANALLARETLGPRTEWIHMPVPKERTDSAYFSPLTRLRLDSSGSKNPHIYLGVKRIETAQANVPFPFGVATECGLGRTPPEEIDSILRICKEVTEEPIRENL
ncbi:hypothetical protein F5Y19DRAFT_463837 [Xylariaceae sp. FL1651]|nr:hypothetical protein F5Y19DRAFT_463837 [Xylariaceae sp. FL1651]